MAFTTKKKATRIAMFVGTVGVSAALVGAGVAGTGAYFSDTKSGAITGTVGSIAVEGGGPLAFTNMLPGVSQTVTGNYQNIGRNAQDVWIVFNNAPSLHTLNQLGSYGEAHVASNGTEIFASQNLNDGYPCGTPGGSLPTLCPLPRALKLADNVSPTLGGNWSFSFNYASKLGNTGAGVTINPIDPAGSWNNYPAGTDPASDAGSGLPYQIVATQVGIAPGA